MIKPLRAYGEQEVKPRLRRILIQPQVVLAIAIFGACFLFGSRLSAAELKLGDIVGMILTYAAIAFGFCITGMALVLTLPSDRFLSALQAHKLNGGGQSSYLDLLFVFSWTAVCHWLLVVVAIIAMLVRGTVPVLLNEWDGWGWRVLISWFFGLCAYSLIQFLLTVITLSQVGQLYSKELTKTGNASKSN
jgi:hypothetical protein